MHSGSGWSEMDDWNDAATLDTPEAKPLAVDTKAKAKPKKMSTSPTELFDVAKLRANVNKLEAEVYTFSATC